MVDTPRRQEQRVGCGARVEVETGRRLRVLHTDHRGEFTSVEFTEYCAERGIQRQHLASYTP